MGGGVCCLDCVQRGVCSVCGEVHSCIDLLNSWILRPAS